MSMKSFDTHSPVPDRRQTAASRRWGITVVTAALGIVTLAAQQQPPGSAPGAPQTPPQPTAIELVITGEPGAPPQYAVPDFVALTPDAADIAKTLGQVLWDDLNYEREFYMIPRDTYSSIAPARTPEQIPWASWRELGADAVVFGTVQRKGDNVLVQVRLFNVRSRESVFSKEYSGSARNPRAYAHTASDEIHLQQRDVRGVARTKLAFVSDRNRERLVGTTENREVKEIYISDYDGANQQRITISRQLNVNPAWSSDGRAIAYTQYQPAPQILISFIYDGILQKPTKAPDSYFTPVFSPDGKRIAVSSNRDGNNEIYVMNVDGSGVRRLTNHPAGDIAPTWNPTGTQIAFTSDRTGVGAPQIYVMNADGTGLRRITTTESYADRATWSPAPYNEIAFTARTPAGFDIKAYDLATGQTRQLTFGEGSNESPSYSPGGRHIAFTSSRAGRVQIFTMTRDGRDVRQVTRDGVNQTPAWSN
jgi:TolB protein